MSPEACARWRTMGWCYMCDQRRCPNDTPAALAAVDVDDDDDEQEVPHDSDSA